MPVAANIVVADHVPTNHTFNPLDITTGNALFAERAIAATSAGFELLRLLFSKSTTRRPTDKTTIRLDMPLEQVVDGVTVVYATARFDGNFTLPDVMTSTQKLKFGALVRNVFAHATVRGVYETGETVWG